jgi:hypothetical protein
MGTRTSAYLDDSLQAAVKASGVPLAELVRRGLAHGTQPEAPATSSPSPGTGITVTGGEPSPGVVCMGPGCWQRDTSRYGLRRIPLCPACAAALQGQTYKRELPPGAARLLKRGAA